MIQLLEGNNYVTTEIDVEEEVEKADLVETAEELTKGPSDLLK